MPDQNLSLPGSALGSAAEILSAELADEEPDPAPANRAERRGKAKKHDPAESRYLGSAGHARPAQGRRINPVRRTG